MSSYELNDPDSGLPVCVKQPGESRLFRMYFTDLLVNAQVTSVTSVVAVSQNKVSGSSSVTVGTNTFGPDYVDVRLSAGTDLENYKITAVVVDTAGNTLEGDGVLYVRNL
jgi:hypothetical protein